MVDFVKYQGTGNDFIIIDARLHQPQNLDVKALCDRRFGIGADGLMLLELHEGCDFKMVYYNSDGNLSSMCGNGGRCLAHFASSLGLGSAGQLHFIAVDGMHHAKVDGDWVSLGMMDPQFEIQEDPFFVLNTGSPHHITFVDSSVSSIHLLDYAHGIRYNDIYKKNGINVNIVRVLGENQLEMRTYERGVEDETLSCGTGVTAAALAYMQKNQSHSEVHIATPGGRLSVTAKYASGKYNNVVLHGPAKFVFQGSI